MNDKSRRSLAGFFVFVATLTAAAIPLIACAGEPSARRSQANDSTSIVGTWRAVAYARVTDSGDTLAPFGRDLAGYLIYDSSGRVFFQVANRDSLRPSPDRVLVDTGAAGRLVRNYAAFFGTYRADYMTHTIRHHPDVELHPMLGQTEVATPFRRHGDTLVIGDSAALHWTLIRVR